MMKKKIPIELYVNGEPFELYVSPNRTLLEVLREDLELIGTKEGCGEGVCGSCTVLWKGSPIRSCLTLATEVQKTEILTLFLILGSIATVSKTYANIFIDEAANTSSASSANNIGIGTTSLGSLTSGENNITVD